jgi:hypothetical protein
LLRVVVQLLDGRRDRGELQDYFMEMYREDRFRLPEELLETATPEEIVAEQLEQALGFLGRSALLIADR